MNSHRRLEWVQTNRVRKDRVQHVGARMERLVKQLEVLNPAVLRDVLSTVTGVVDNEFRAHCRIAVAGGNTLVVEVDQAALVYSMRVQWLSPLREALSLMRSRRSISRILFEFGTAGICLPEFRA